MKKLAYFLVIIFLFFPNGNKEHQTRNVASLKDADISQIIFEDLSWYKKQPLITTIKGTPTPLNIRKIDSLDIRGVGDSAILNLNGNEAKQIFLSSDPKKEVFIGDISFINWESVIGITCLEKRASVDFYFLSNPQTIQAAVEHGFNIFGLSNNHSQDCNKGKAFEQSPPKRGPLMSSESMEKMYPAGHSILWHGVGPNRKKVSEENIIFQGKKVKVSFMSLSIVGWDISDAASLNFTNRSHAQVMEEAEDYLKAFDQSEAKIRILSLHTQDGSGNNKNEDRAFLFLKEISELFIDKYDGKIIFGQGPHTKGGIQVYLNRENKPHAVIFTSLGNFIHQGLAIHGDNYLGRIILDFSSPDLIIKEIQAIPLKNEKTKISFYDINSIRVPETTNRNAKQIPFNGTPSAPYSNFEWTKSNLIEGQNYSNPIAGYYAIFK